MFVYYINVPLNKNGVKEFESYDDVMPNVKTYELSQQEYELLRKEGGLFSRFDSELGTIIDVCEEERINLEHVDKAIDIVERYGKKCLDEYEKNACVVVLESLFEAQRAGTFWEIDIYLE